MSKFEGEPLPACTDYGCEPPEETPLHQRAAECVHCGCVIRRDHLNHWHNMEREEAQ